MNKHIIFIFSVVMLSACTRSFDGDYSFSLIYKIDLQQGNVIDQEMLNKLKPGIDKNRVKFIMGTPALIDPFHNNHWEYVYSFQKADGIREQRHITLHFEEDKLAYISGDVQVASLANGESKSIKE